VIFARDVWRSTALTAAGSQAVGAVSFASSIVIARAVAPHELGRYALVAAIIAIATSAGSMQMNGFCVVVDQLTPTVLRSALALELAAGIVSFMLVAGGAIGYGLLAGDSAFAGLVILGALVLLSNPFGCLASQFNRRLAYGATTAALVVSQALGAALKAALALAGFGAGGLLAGDVAISVVFALWMLAIVPEGRGLGVDRASLRAQLEFGIPSLLTGVLSTGAQRGQDLVVAATLGTRQLGFFYLASRICGQVYQFGRSLTLALLPAFSRASDGELARRFVVTTRLSAFFVGIPLAVLAVEARGVVSSVFGDRWQPAAAPLVLLFGAVGLRFVFWHVGNLLKARGRVREMTALTAAQLVFVVAGTYIGGRAGGLVGIAAASVGIELVLTLPRLALIRSVIPFSLWRTLRAPLTTVALAACAGAPVTVVVPGAVGLGLAAAVIVGVGAAGIWASEAATVLVAIGSFRRSGREVQPQV
jgi:PST family polysaccharide transporter